MSVSILGICCSPRKVRSTFAAMQVCLDSARECSPHIETQLVELAEKKIGPCTACGICKQGLICGWDDDFSDLIPLLSQPDLGGIIIGTPVYFGGMTAQRKAFIDRCVVFRRNDWKLRDKVDTGWARERVQQAMTPVLKEDPKTTLGRAGKGQMRLDVSTLHDKGSIKAPYSLDHRTGLVSLPLQDKAHLDRFQKSDATIREVLKSAGLAAIFEGMKSAEADNAIDAPEVPTVRDRTPTVEKPNEGSTLPSETETGKRVQWTPEKGPPWGETEK